MDVGDAAFSVPPQQLITHDGGIIEIGAEVRNRMMMMTMMTMMTMMMMMMTMMMMTMMMMMTVMMMTSAADHS